MFWMPLALLSAFFQATTDALTKKSLGGADYYMVAWLRNVLSVPFMLAVVIVAPFPHLDRTFFLTVCAMLPLEVVGTILYTKAIRLSPLSLTMPFMALTPVWLLLTSFPLLGEVPSRAGVVGVLILAVGAYLLNAHKLKDGGPLAPIRAIYHEKGSMIMLAVSGVYALTCDLSKIAVQHSSPLFFSAFYQVAFSLVFTPITLGRSKCPLSAMKPQFSKHLAMGAALAATGIFQNLAILQSQVSYVIAVKRTSLLFAIGFGYLMFSEKNMRARLFGSCVMLAGLAVMTLF